MGCQEDGFDRGISSKKAVQAFVKTWQGRGDEKRGSASSWTDFLIRCLGVMPETLPS